MAAFIGTTSTAGGTASTASGTIYFSNSGTSNSTISDWVDSVPVSGPPQRIMQRQPLRALDFIPRDHLIGSPGDEAMIDASIERMGMKILEIPYHRIYRGMKHYKVEPNTLLELPDGTFIDIEDEYNYKIHDAQTQITREECTIRAFNRFLNASELLEAFIKDLAPTGIRQNQVLKVPVEAFINWLIFKAAEADGDPLPDEYYNHRCLYCQRFIPRKLVVLGVNVCNPRHLDGYFKKMKLLEAQ